MGQLEALSPNLFYLNLTLSVTTTNLLTLKNQRLFQANPQNQPCLSLNLRSPSLSLWLNRMKPLGFWQSPRQPNRNVKLPKSLRSPMGSCHYSSAASGARGAAKRRKRPSPTPTSDPRSSG